MKIALAQMNPRIGDYAANCRRMFESINRAKREGCDLIVFPEMALTGTPTHQLLADRESIRASQAYWDELVQASHSIGIVCGVISTHAQRAARPHCNSVLFCAQGTIKALGHKRALSRLGSLDERCYFEPGRESAVVEFKGLRLGLCLGRDLLAGQAGLSEPVQDENQPDNAEAGAVDLMISPSAWPYRIGMQPNLEAALCNVARRQGVKLVWVNQVGGNDGLLFQGHSLAVADNGQVQRRGADFLEDLLLWETSTQEVASGKDLSVEAEVVAALRLGVGDYAKKNGFSSAVVGLSDDVRSGVTACLARMALGAENVLAVGISGAELPPEQVQAAREIAARAGIGFREVCLDRVVPAVQQAMHWLDDEIRRPFESRRLASRLASIILASCRDRPGRLLLCSETAELLQNAQQAGLCHDRKSLFVLGDISDALAGRLAAFIADDYGWLPKRLGQGPGPADWRDRKDERIEESAAGSGLDRIDCPSAQPGMWNQCPLRDPETARGPQQLMEAPVLQVRGSGWHHCDKAQTGADSHLWNTVPGEEA